MPVQNTASQVTKLQNDVSKLGSSIAVMNKRLLDNPTHIEKEHTETSNGHTTKHYTASTTYADKANPARSSTELTGAHMITPGRIAENSAAVNLTTTPISPINTTITTESVEEAAEREAPDHQIPKTAPMKSNEPPEQNNRDHTTHEQETREWIDNDNSGNRFIAARRRKITSYFIGNIDASVDETDVWEYLSESPVKPTHITMFYGKSGSSARMNVHYEDEERVESEDFWPEGVTCRKWVSKTEWDKEREHNQKQRNRSYRHRSTHYKHNYRDDTYEEPRHRDRDSSSRPSRSYNERNYNPYLCQADRDDWN